MSAEYPHWVHVEGGRNRCTVCGAFVTNAWVCYVKPTVYKHAMCEPCVAEKIGEEVD